MMVTVDSGGMILIFAACRAETLAARETRAVDFQPRMPMQSFTNLHANVPKCAGKPELQGGTRDRGIKFIYRDHCCLDSYRRVYAATGADGRHRAR